MKKEAKDIVVRGVLLLLAIALMAAVALPINYYIEKPGMAESLNGMITVDGEKDENAGSFMLTTVSIQRATLLSAFVSKFSSFNEIISQEEYLGGATSAEYEILQEHYMENSQIAAIKVAMDLAEVPYELTFKGIYVWSVTDQSDFKNSLKVGDVITAVDGQSFESSTEFMNYVKGKEVGDTVTITFQRSGETHTASGTLYELETDHKAGIGITLIDETELTSDTKVKIDASGIGGPSAGLMFTLEIYSLLSQQDLRKGYEVAGTGTMSADGTVGRIGGINKKIVAAANSGAEIFFAPDDEITDAMKEANPAIQSNYEEALAAAKEIKTNMKIVPVKTVKEALNYLEKLEAK